MMKRGITTLRGALSSLNQQLRSHKQGLAIHKSKLHQRLGKTTYDIKRYLEDPERL